MKTKRSSSNPKVLYRNPFIASEMFGCESDAIIDAMLEHKDILAEFWKFLDTTEPLNILLASYFAKINAILLAKRTGVVWPCLTLDVDLSQE